MISATTGRAAAAATDEVSTELAAGGLVLASTDNVAVEREDLTISPSEIKARYTIRNNTGRSVQLRVAFPMPEVPRETPTGLSTATSLNVIMSPLTEPNFLGSRVWANGREVRPELEIHAILPDGRDVTDALRQIGGLRLLLRPGTFDAAMLSATSAGPELDAVTRGKLEAIGALEEDDNIYELRWATHIAFAWMQDFAPGVTVIDHSYRPIIGAHVVEVQPGAVLDRHEKQRYCIDPSTERTMRSITRRNQLNAFTVGYILQEAKNRRGPIGTFHLTLEGDDVRFADAPAARVRLMSLCTDLSLTQTGPMRFEGTMKDYVPAYDLLVLMLTD